MIGDVNINYLLRLLEFVLAITLFEYMMHCYGIIPVSSWHNIISWMLSKAIQKVLYYKLYTGLQYVLLKLFQISETNQCPMQVLPVGLVLAADNHVYHWQVDELWLPWLPTAMYHQVLVSCMCVCDYAICILWSLIALLLLILKLQLQLLLLPLPLPLPLLPSSPPLPLQNVWYPYMSWICATSWIIMINTCVIWPPYSYPMCRR